MKTSLSITFLLLLTSVMLLPGCPESHRTSIVLFDADSGAEVPDATLCEPGARSCLNKTTVQVCNADGTVLTETQCIGNQTCLNGTCTSECVPACDGLECGDNGCGGSCGKCGEGFYCEAGACLEGICSLGDTRCSGGGLATCILENNLNQWGPPEPCQVGFACVDDQCLPTTDCGDITWVGCCTEQQLYYCDAGVLMTQSCSAKPDCGWDTGAGIYDCSTSGQEDPSQLHPRDCQPCQPECEGKDCGEDGCGGVCGSCDDDELCALGGHCIPTTCQSGADLCAGNVAMHCGEDGSWMEEDCGDEAVCLDGRCIPQCQPTCDGKECGPDGCGATCGNCGPGCMCSASGQCLCDDCVPGETRCDGNNLMICLGDGVWAQELCPDGWTCQEGKCTPGCVGSCEGRECGSDGCGGSCGVCPNNMPCTGSGLCLPPTCQDGEMLCDGSSILFCKAGEWLAELCPQGWYCLDNQCMPGCEPQCWNRQCGPDGCGGSCGQCPDNSYCTPNGKCLQDQECYPGDRFCEGDVQVICDDSGIWTYIPCPDGTWCDPWLETSECMPWCIPQCDGKACGPDTCGGTCGTCSPGKQCTGSGVCISLSCQPGEVVCDGDRILFCAFDGTWHPENCPQGWTCQYGECVEGCQASCWGKECGPDGCGGTCGYCPWGTQCSNFGKCQQSFQCEPGLTICEGDLLLLCDDMGQWVFQPCPTGWRCESGECVSACLPECSNRDCGPNGCGGSCGSCPIGSSCNSGGICEQTCQPSCLGKTCGSNGCGGLCGVCDQDEACVGGACQTSLTCQELQSCSWQCNDDEACSDQCWLDASPDAQAQWLDVMQCLQTVCMFNPTDSCYVQAISPGGGCRDEWNSCQSCTPECEGKHCGPDGCGGTCGTCPAGFGCDAHGYCLCQPQCDDRTCGYDGCGGSCGTCQAGDVCNYLGHCVCMPDCAGKECGTNGCGGSCGSCNPGDTCSPTGECIGVQSQCGDGWCQTNLGESCQTCPVDCGGCGCQQPGNIPDCDGICGPSNWIGDGYCDDSTFGYNFNCEQFDWDGGDCFAQMNCGNGICEPDFGEDCMSCPDCAPCENCPAGYIKDCNGLCAQEWWLGDGFCDNGQYDGINLNCAQLDWDAGDCPIQSVCGDGICQNQESCSSCPQDCGMCYQGDCCQAQQTAGCDDPDISGCVCDIQPLCCGMMWFDECASLAQELCGLDCGCVPQCSDRECGPDGCGGTCGVCPTGSTCQSGSCIGTNQTSCQGIVDCVSSTCEGMGDVLCLMTCYQSGTPDGQNQAQSLYNCVSEVCGWDGDNECMEMAIHEDCLPFYQACK